MAKKRKARLLSTADIHKVKLPAQLRVVGRERSAQQVIANAAKAANHASAIQFRTDESRGEADESERQTDYAQIDPVLAVQPAPLMSEAPSPGTGYSGFTPIQRHHFLQWATQAQSAAPPTFRRLYIAQLETSLFDETAKAVAAHEELLHLADAPAWQQEMALWRALLLSFWLRQDGAQLSEWLTTAPTVPTPLEEIAFGHLALLGQPLLIEHIRFLLQQWRLPQQMDDAILRLRMSYLSTTVGTELLAHALTQLDPTKLIAQPWRCAHRQLRIALPQPAIRTALEPLLREIATVVETPLVDEFVAGVDTNPGESVPDSADDNAPRSTAEAVDSKKQWRLLLEFGDSRSEYFDYILQHAQRQPGYLQIMDENRRMVHRIQFEKRDLRRFWFLWEYVQNWSTTQVFVNGKELRKWEIYPYSPYLR